ncbi:MAG: DUF4350 domain-containing protein [Actinomycetota bacterium]
MNRAWPPRRVRSRVRVVAVLLSLVAIGVAITLVAGNPSGYAPYSPDSPEPAGLKALRLLLEQAGSGLKASTEPSSAGIILVPRDDLSSRQRESLLATVRSGSRLVLTDLDGKLGETLSVGAVELSREQDLTPQCISPLTQGVEAIEILPETAVYLPLDPRVPASVCFAGGKGAFMIDSPYGSGEIVMLSEPWLLTNEGLGERDNAVLAHNLLAAAGRAVTLLEGGLIAGTGEETLSSIMPRGAKAALLQLLVAFAALAAWRARRLGLPPADPGPVSVPGSEIVLAAGGLLHRAGAAGHAARRIQSDLRRTLKIQLGLPADLPVGDLARIAGERTALTAADLAAVLDPIPDTLSASGLVAFAQKAQAVRRLLDHSTRAAGGPAAADRGGKS